MEDAVAAFGDGDGIAPDVLPSAAFRKDDRELRMTNFDYKKI